FANNSNAITADHSFIGALGGGITVTGSPNQIGTLASPLNPQLGPLQFNGGINRTHAPLTGSPLLDQGSNPGGLSFDQRGPGFPRALNGSPDIGSIEAVSPIPVAVPTVSDVLTGGATAYNFSVTYISTPPALMDVSTLDSQDVRITGPGGTFNVLASFVSSTPTANAVTVTANYSFVPPGGVWGITDYGTYTVSIEPILVTL